MSRHVDALVVGSGPGGAVTARALAEAGLETLLVEEGPDVQAGSVRPFSLDQMRRQYRNQGLTVALGRPSIAYTEGRCLGGGSEVNSGLYHRPSSALLAAWSAQFGIEALGARDLTPVHQRIEAELSVRKRPGGLATTGSALLRRGAQELGWHGVEVAQWVAIDADESMCRQTMSRTYLPAARRAGAEARTDVSVRRLLVEGDHAVGVELCTVTDAAAEVVTADTIFVCAGATQTPALLQRSGLRRCIGANLSVHPTVKVVAEFADEVNDVDDLATFQVKEFGPGLSFGGSASAPALLALAHAESGVPEEGAGGLAVRMREWRCQLVYYAAIQSDGRGRVQALPGFRDPLVTYRLTRTDRARLAEASARLTHLALAMGARVVYPAFPGAGPVRDREQAADTAARFRAASASLMTVHLTGTAPMGELRDRCATDSFGRVHEMRNVYVNDASLLPWAPGVNPQGTVMAVAQRNVSRFLEGRGAGAARSRPQRTLSGIGVAGGPAQSAPSEPRVSPK